MGLYNDLVKYTVTHPAAQIFQGADETFRRFIAHSINTAEMLTPQPLIGLVTRPLRHYGVGPQRLADSGIVVENLAKPANAAQHFLSWGINSPGFDVYDNGFLEGTRKFVAGSVNALEAAVPMISTANISMLSGGGLHASWSGGEFLAGLGLGHGSASIAQGLKSEMYRNAAPKGSSLKI